MKTQVFALAILGSSLFAAAASATQYSYIVGLDPVGDNWLALRSEPSGSHGTRIKKMGPETLLTVLDTQGDWTEVRTTTSETGWVSSKYLACCRDSAVSSQDVGSPNSEATAVMRAFREQSSAPRSMHLYKTVVVSGWAIQNWGDENSGGQAILKLTQAKGWVLIQSSGGAWDVSSLVGRGVPPAVAEQLIAVGERQ